MRRWIVSVLILAACAPGADREPPLRVVATDETAADALVSGATRLGLTRLDAEGRVIPGLAQSWRVSDDGSFIIFRLRPVLARGGRALVGEDIVRAIAAARGPRGDPAIRPLLEGIREVRAPLPDVVELRLSTPQPEMLEILALPALAIHETRAARRPIPDVPGPFRRLATEAGEPVRLERDPDYFDAGAVALSAATVAVLPPAAAAEAFQRREVDLVLGDHLAGLGAAQVAGGREAFRLSRSRAMLVLEPDPDSLPLRDPRVRQVLALGIDRARVLRAGSGGDDLEPSLRLTPSGLSGYPAPGPAGWAAIPPRDRRDEARRLLAEALGPAAGEEDQSTSDPLAAAAGSDPASAAAAPPTLALSVERPRSVEERRLLEAVAADLAPLGLTLAFASREAADLRLRVLASPIDSPLPFLLPLRCTPARASICLPEADRLLAESFEELTLAGRMARIAAAEALHVEAATLIPIGEPLRWMLVSPGVKGVAANRAGLHPLALVRREGD